MYIRIGWSEQVVQTLGAYFSNTRNMSFVTAWRRTRASACCDVWVKEDML